MGKVLSDLDDIKARWKRYTESLYEDKDSTQHRDSASTEATDQDKAMPILDEVRDAIRRLPRDKAAGYDNLSTAAQIHSALSGILDINIR